jgi:hypothetical protein
METDYFIIDNTSSSLIILTITLVKSRLDISNLLSTNKKSFHLTGPRYLSSQARVSLIYSVLGGIWSVS